MKIPDTDFNDQGSCLIRLILGIHIFSEIEHVIFIL